MGPNTPGVAEFRVKTCSSPGQSHRHETTFSSKTCLIYNVVFCLVFVIDILFDRLLSNYSNGMTWYDLIRVQFNFSVVSCARTFHFGCHFLFRYRVSKIDPSLRLFYQHPWEESHNSPSQEVVLDLNSTGGPRTTTPPGFRCSPGSRFVRGGFVVWSLPGNCHFGMICCEIFRLIIKWEPFLGGSNNICKCMVIVSDCSFNQKQKFCKMELNQNKMNKHG